MWLRRAAFWAVAAVTCVDGLAPVRGSAAPKTTTKMLLSAIPFPTTALVSEASRVVLPVARRLCVPLVRVATQTLLRVAFFLMLGLLQTLSARGVKFPREFFFLDTRNTPQKKRASTEDSTQIREIMKRPYAAPGHAESLSLTKAVADFLSNQNSGRTLVLANRQLRRSLDDLLRGQLHVVDPPIVPSSSLEACVSDYLQADHTLSLDAIARLVSTVVGDSDAPAKFVVDVPADCTEPDARRLLLSVERLKDLAGDALVPIVCLASHYNLAGLRSLDVLAPKTREAIRV